MKRFYLLLALLSICVFVSAERRRYRYPRLHRKHLRCLNDHKHTASQCMKKYRELLKDAPVRRVSDESPLERVLTEHHREVGWE